MTGTKQSRCPYGNTVRIYGQHQPCGSHDTYCGQCKTDGSYITEAEMLDMSAEQQ